MGVHVTCSYEDTGEPLGIYAAEGMVAQSGSFLARWRGRADTAFAVVCRDMIAADRKKIRWLLAEFEQWFDRDFPHNIHPFSTEVVRRQWQNILAGVPETEVGGAEVAALLVHQGRYVFANRGELAVYEYLYGKKKYRRWHTGRERERLDEELGVLQEQRVDFQFWSREIRERTLILIVPGGISLKDPLARWSRRRLKRFADGLTGEVCSAVAVAVER